MKNFLPLKNSKKVSSQKDRGKHPTPRCIEKILKKYFKIPGELYLVLVVSICLSLTATTSGQYQAEDPPVTATEAIVTQEPGTEEPAGNQDSAVEPEAAQPPVEAPVQYEEEETVEILVRLSKRKSPDEIIPEHAQGSGKTWKFTENDELGKLNIFVLNVPASKAQEEIQRLQNLPGVLYAEPNYWLEAADTIPNDPDFPSQYALTAIHAPQGWDISTGAATVTIAIVDSGVDYGHAELAGKLVPGYDFVNSDSIAQDDTGHGSHVAGIAAASSNNGLGIAGVSWGARIMPVKVLNASNAGTYADTAAGIIWAADQGAQIINLSLGGNDPSITLENAVNYAAGKGALVIASAGNSGENLVLYPARYPVVMAVAATDASDLRASFSNFGPEVDIAAPGDQIYSLAIGGYTTRNGTSMAAAHVTGLAAVLWDGSAYSVRWKIETTALDVEMPGWDPYTGAGLIQMDAALGAPPAPTATPPPTATFVPFSQPGFNNPPAGLVTWTPLSAGGAALTFTPTTTPTATVTSTASPVTTTATLNTSTPGSELSAQGVTQSRWQERLRVFLSPLFCGGTLLVLAGLWWAWVSGQRQRRKNKNTSGKKVT